jgi:hypothetical protein
MAQILRPRETVSSWPSVRSNSTDAASRPACRWTRRGPLLPEATMNSLPCSASLSPIKIAPSNTCASLVSSPPRACALFRDGKRRVYKVGKELAEAVNALNRDTLNLVTRMVSIPARTLRAGAVLAPEFIARNPVRDQFTALAFSEHGYPPPGKIPPCENTPLIQSLFREHALSGYAPHIGNVRAALGWALLDHGDAAVGSRVVPSIIMKSSGQSFMECHRLCQPMKFDRGKCIPATLPDRIARMYLDMVGEWEHLKCPSRRGQIGCFSSSHLRRAGSALALGSRTIMRWCT